MKTWLPYSRFPCLATCSLFALIVAASWPVWAGDVFWINPAGGNWSNTNNWSNGKLPAISDNAFITADGSYTVTLDVNATVLDFTFGAAGGQFLITTNRLTVARAGLFNSNSEVNLTGGTLSGTNVVTGTLNWTGGTISGELTIATNAVLNISGAATKNVGGDAVVRNFGTVIWAGSGTIDLGTRTLIDNQASAVIDLQSDATISANPTSFGIANAGVWRKSAGSGTNSIFALFAQSGTVEAQVGTISFNRTFTVSEPMSVSGAGRVQYLTTIRFTGPITSFDLTGGTLSGTNVVTGTLNWTGGTISDELTIATNAVLNISGAATKNVGSGAVVRNFGTVIWAESGTINLGTRTLIDNQASAVIDLQSDATISADPTSLGIANAGVWRKSAGSGTNSIFALFAQSGTVEAQVGTISFNRTFTVNEPTSISGAGRVQYLSAIRFTGPITSFDLTGGTLSGTNVVTGTLNWTGGTISGELTIATNAVVNISGAATKNVGGDAVVRNFGTVIWAGSGTINLGSRGLIDNQAGAVIDLQSDASISANSTSLGIANAGVWRKSAGNGTNSIVALFAQSGTVEVQVGTISFGSTFAVGEPSVIQGAGQVQYRSQVRFTGPITDFNLTSGTLSGTNIVSGTLTWSGGSINGELTVATNGVLNISGAGERQLPGRLDNAGTVVWTTTDRLSLGTSGRIQIRESGVFDVRNDETITYQGSTNPARIDNLGLFRKSTGTNTTTVFVPFFNSGRVEARTGALVFGGGGNISGTFAADGGAEIRFDSGPFIFSQKNFTGNGTIHFGSNARIALTEPITDFEFSEGILTDTNVVTGTLNWTGGTVSGRLIVATNALLNITGPGPKELTGVLENHGKVIWSGTGSISVSARNGRIENLSSGVFAAQAAANLGGVAGTVFNNQGTLRGSGTTGPSGIYVFLENRGAVEAVSGTLVIAAGISAAPESVLSFVLGGPQATTARSM